MDLFKLFPQFRLNIDNLSQILSFSKSKIRFLEKEFYPFINPQRDSSRRRLYSRKDLVTFLRIKELAESGVCSYSDIKAKFEEQSVKHLF